MSWHACGYTQKALEGLDELLTARCLMSHGKVRQMREG